MMPQGQGNQLAHGYPGTPVGDLFPLGQAVLGSGSQSSLRPIRAGELRAHSAVTNNLLSRYCVLPESRHEEVTSGWRALTDALTSLVIQVRSSPISKPPITRVSKITAEWGINFQLQIQNCPASRLSCPYREGSVGILAENLFLQTDTDTQFQVTSFTDTDFRRKIK